MRRHSIAIVSIVTMTLSLASGVSAAELLYYFRPGPTDPMDMTRELSTVEGAKMRVRGEPAARIDSARVKEALIVREEVEVLDEEDPISAIFYVRLTLEDADLAKVTKAMDEACKTERGVFIALDGMVIDYRPLVVCGHFRPEVSFADLGEAEEFAKKISPKAVRIVTPEAK